MYIIQCTLYTIHCTVYSVQRTVYYVNNVFLLYNRKHDHCNTSKIIYKARSCDILSPPDNTFVIVNWFA